MTGNVRWLVEAVEQSADPLTIPSVPSKRTTHVPVAVAGSVATGRDLVSEEAKAVEALTAVFANIFTVAGAVGLATVLMLVTGCQASHDARPWKAHVVMQEGAAR